VIYHGIGLNEETVVKYFNVAKDSSLGKMDRKVIRSYLNECSVPELSLWQYRIRDPFERLVIVPTFVQYSIEFEEIPCLGEVVDIGPIRQDAIEAIIDANIHQDTTMLNTAYTYVVGYLSRSHTKHAIYKTIERLARDGKL